MGELRPHASLENVRETERSAFERKRVEGPSGGKSRPYHPVRLKVSPLSLSLFLPSSPPLALPPTFTIYLPLRPHLSRFYFFSFSPSTSRSGSFRMRKLTREQSDFHPALLSSRSGFPTVGSCHLRKSRVAIGHERINAIGKQKRQRTNNCGNTE